MVSVLRASFCSLLSSSLIRTVLMNVCHMYRIFYKIVFYKSIRIRFSFKWIFCDRQINFCLSPEIVFFIN